MRISMVIFSSSLLSLFARLLKRQRNMKKNQSNISEIMFYWSWLNELFGFHIFQIKWNRIEERYFSFRYLCWVFFLLKARCACSKSTIVITISKWCLILADNFGIFCNNWMMHCSDFIVANEAIYNHPISCNRITANNWAYHWTWVHLEPNVCIESVLLWTKLGEPM